MPIYNVTVDDSSPMIIYSQGWVDSNASDPTISSYSGSTFHATDATGATASISFFGSAVYVFGATRQNYGPFTVTLDGQTTSHNAAASGNSEFQQVLFNETGLSNGTHLLILTNNGTGTFMDIDFITFTTGDGNTSVMPTNSTLDDSSPNVTYSPSSSAWQTNSFEMSSYFNTTLHTSQVQGAQATIPFTGDAVSIYGATDQNHGTFTVRVDDQDAVSLNGSAPSFRPQTLLYWFGGLHHGQHTVTLTNTDDALYLDFDDVVATSWSATNSSTKRTPSLLSRAKTPVIAGTISGACVVIAWIVALFLLLRRRRKRRLLRQTGQKEAEPRPFILPPDPAVVQGLHQPGTRLVVDRKGRSSKIIKTLPPRPPDTAPVASGSGSTSSAPPTHAQSRSVDSVRGSSRDAGRSTPNAAASTSTSAPEIHRDQSDAVSAPSSLPARSDPRESSNASLSAAELSASRMVVPNRPQDWGPVPTERDYVDEGLPPNYTQATQPMPRGQSVDSR